ncbi:hypothetical protein Gohar_011194 [Gossypium harknessii]|uniref:Uncharacterized protein n=1 Tax=Gossypium harknessii TaxID=34285 RepID=A0A7J9GT66_9ROSI|nr:hypothetical protein [Gossypium harknessii]
MVASENYLSGRMMSFFRLKQKQLPDLM